MDGKPDLTDQNIEVDAGGHVGEVYQAGRDITIVRPGTPTGIPARAAWKLVLLLVVLLGGLAVFYVYTGREAGQVEPAKPGETLILVADFDVVGGGKCMGVDPADYIHDRLKNSAKGKAWYEKGYAEEEKLRVRRLHQVVDENTARPVGESYNAAMLVWGRCDSLTVTPYLERIAPLPELDTPEGLHFSMGDPERVEFLITQDLPSHVTYITMLTLGIGELGRKDKAGARDYDRALSYLDAALDALDALDAVPGGDYSTRPWEGFFYRGTAYLLTGEYEKAQADLLASIELAPEEPTAYYNLGIVMQIRGENLQAVEAFGRAIEADPESALAARAYKSRGLLHYAGGDFRDAAADFSAGIRLEDSALHLSLLYHNRGLANFGLEEYRQAVDDYDRALELRPDFLVVYLHRGEAYAAMEEWESAGADFEEYLSLSPPDDPNRHAAQKNLSDLPR